MPPRKVLPSVASAGGPARERLAGAGEHSAPECLQSVAPVCIATVTAAALIPMRSGGAGCHGALVAHAAAKCCLPGPSDLPIDVTSVAGLVHSTCIVARALHARHRSHVACVATRALHCHILAVAFVVAEVAIALATSVQGALG